MMAVEITEAKSVTEGLMFWKARRRTGATYTTSSGCRYQVSGVRLELFEVDLVFPHLVVLRAQQFHRRAVAKGVEGRPHNPMPPPG